MRASGAPPSLGVTSKGGPRRKARGVAFPGRDGPLAALWKERSNRSDVARGASPRRLRPSFRSSCLVTRLESRPRCLRGETGSIPVRGAAARRKYRPQSHGDQRFSKFRREGSIPSRPADVHETSTRRRRRKDGRHDDDELLLLRGSRPPSDGMRLREANDRVQAMHGAVLVVAALAREQEDAEAARGSRRTVGVVLRGRWEAMTPVRASPDVPRRAPSNPNPSRGDGSTGEHCFRTAEIGVRFPVAPLTIRASRSIPETCESRLEAARVARDRSSRGEQPVCTRSMRVRFSPIPLFREHLSNSKTPVFQTGDEGAIPSVRSVAWVAEAACAILEPVL
jgi:hypothetical protein